MFPLALLKVIARPLANILTSLRLVLSPLVTLCVVMRIPIWGVVVACILAAFDYLDGELARYSESTSHFWAKMDRIADFALCFFLLIGIICLEPKPGAWFVAWLVVTAYFFGDALEARSMRHLHDITEANDFSKLKSAALMGTLIYALTFRSLGSNFAAHYVIVATGIVAAAMFGRFALIEYQQSRL